LSLSPYRQWLYRASNTRRAGGVSHKIQNEPPVRSTDITSPSSSLPSPVRTHPWTFRSNRLIPHGLSTSMPHRNRFSQTHPCMRVRVSTNTYARTILHLINKYSISAKLYLIKRFFFLSVCHRVPAYFIFRYFIKLIKTDNISSIIRLFRRTHLRV